MTRLVQSLQFRLVLVLFVLIGLSVAWSVINARSVDQLNTSGAQIELASLQRSNSYLLSSLAQRLDTATDEVQQTNIEALTRQTIANVDENQNILRNGNAETEAIDSPEVIVLLDTLDEEWASYKSVLEDFLEASPEDRSALLAQINNQSISFFTFSDRVVGALQALQEQNRADNQQISNGLLGIGVITTLVVTAMIIQIALSVRQLTGELQAFAEGNLAIRASASNVLEIQSIGQVFNDTANRLQSLIDDLNKQIVEVQKAREAAEKSDQVKSAFLASMSHELRTPLNAIINFTKFVALGDFGDVNEEQKETLFEVVDSAQHLLNLINDVLDMSKIEANSLNLFVRENVDLTQILTSVMSMAQAMLNDKPIEIRNTITADLPQIRADEQRVRQILLNILSNAVKYTDKGYVEVRAKQDGGDIIIAVEDTGLGIAKEDQPAVFEAFKQTSSGLRKGGGTGLGIPISKSLVEIHGGRLWLESEPNKGSTFYVALPVKSDRLEPNIVS